MTKDRILQVAAQEFATYGYDAVSMSSLVKKLDVNKATIYYHYKDKKSLYIEVIKTAIISMNENTRKLFKQNLEPEAFLKAYIEVEIQEVKDKPYLPALILRETANLGADVDESIMPYFEEGITYLQMVLDKLPLKQKYEAMSVHAFFSMIMGSIYTFYSMQTSPLPVGTKDELKHDGDKSLEYIADFIYTMLIDAICN